MTSLLRMVVAALVAAFLGWSAVAPDAVASSTSTTAIYTYDGQHHPVGEACTTPERGPPGTYDHTMAAHHAETPRSLGVSTCPDGPTSPAAYDYDDLAWLAQIAHRSGGIERQVGSTEASSVVIARSDVAANDVAAVGARDATVEATTEGQRFVRIGARPRNLKWTFEHPGGTAPGTYAVPEDYFNSISHDPAFLKDIFDLPDSSLPQYYRILEPPAGTPIQYGTVPGGEFGGSGGAPEVLFPKGY